MSLPRCRPGGAPRKDPAGTPGAACLLPKQRGPGKQGLTLRPTALPRPHLFPVLNASGKLAQGQPAPGHRPPAPPPHGSSLCPTQACWELASPRSRPGDPARGLGQGLPAWRPGPLCCPLGACSPAAGHWRSFPGNPQKSAPLRPPHPQAMPATQPALIRPHLPDQPWPPSCSSHAPLTPAQRPLSSSAPVPCPPASAPATTAVLSSQPPPALPVTPLSLPRRKVGPAPEPRPRGLANPAPPSQPPPASAGSGGPMPPTGPGSPARDHRPVPTVPLQQDALPPSGSLDLAQPTPNWLPKPGLPRPLLARACHQAQLLPSPVPDLGSHQGSSEQGGPPPPPHSHPHPGPEERPSEGSSYHTDSWNS